MCLVPPEERCSTRWSAGQPTRRSWRSWLGAVFAPSCPLRDALEGCFSSHHALMVGKIVAHIDYLDESIGDLSVEIERMIVPFSEQVELLGTIPGVNRGTAGP